MRTAIGMAIGAALAYFLDPDQGRRRRHMARDQAAARLRRGSEQAQGAARAASAEAYGVTQKVAAAAREEEPPPNDQALAAKVESEIFRDADVPKGKINVDAADGVVTLRGEVEDEKLIEKLEKEARKISGVRDVSNLLHPPGTPAPNVPAGSGG